MRLPSIWRRHFLGLELGLAVLATAVFFIWACYFGGASSVEGLLYSNRTSLYRTMATAAISLLGFSLAVISIVVGFSSYERLAVIRTSKHYATLWKVFFHTVDSLALLSVTALVCLVFDKDKAPVLWLQTLFLLFVLLSVLRVARSIWVLKQIVWLVARPSPED